jgi:hypothetical protein
MPRSRSLLFVNWLLLTVPFATHAQPGGSVIQAASCQRTDVNAVINGPTHTAVNGDTIQIPAGSCTWNSGIAISGVGFTIKGAGTPNNGAGPCVANTDTCGAGSSTTILIDNAKAPLFRAINIPVGSTMRISQLQVQPVAGAAASSIIAAFTFVGTCTLSGCPNMRVDNITWPAGWADPVNAGGLIIANNMFGVIDHNTATGSTVNGGPPLVQVAHASWQGVGVWGDNSWATPDTFGTNQALYIENNNLANVRGTENDVGDTSLGGNRDVCRYNLFNPATITCSSHGTAWGGRFRGTRQEEFYRNTVVCTASPNCDAVHGLLSGTEKFFENSMNGLWASYLSIDVPREWKTGAPWFWCDGGTPYDTNDGNLYASGTITTGGSRTFSDAAQSWSVSGWTNGTINANCNLANFSPCSIFDVTQNVGSDIIANTATQYTFNNSVDVIPGVVAPYLTWVAGDSYQIRRAIVCIDQVARSGGALLQGDTTPVLVSTGLAGPVNEPLVPIYEWADTQVGNAATPINAASQIFRLKANRDYYNETHNQAAQSNSTTPFSGATGVGHGTLANRPTTCTTGVAYWATDQGSWNVSGTGAQGQLYGCSPTNTWSLIYTPYTYPHPLEGTGIAWSPTAYAFGTVNAGNSANSSNLTLTNSGTLTVNVNLTITGPDAARFTTFSTTCGSTLAATASCNTIVTFSPIAAASYTAALTQTDPSTGTIISVALTGTGIAGTAPVVLPSAPIQLGGK